MEKLQKDGGSSGNATNGNSNVVSPQRGNQQGGVKDQKQRMTKQMHDSISCIFKLISDTQTSKEGIAKLYDFKVNLAIEERERAVDVAIL